MTPYCRPARKHAMHHRAPPHIGRPTIGQVITVSAKAFGVPVDDLLGPSRRRPLIVARHVAMAVCRAVTGASYPTIAMAFGGRDHTTVINACHRAENLPELAQLLAYFEAEWGTGDEIGEQAS